MSEIKLEVGKTYRNRKGEEVKIVWKDNAKDYPFKGSSGLSYTESGRYNVSVEELSHDLIEELPEPCYAFITPDNMKNRYTFTIPEGATRLTVEQVSNRIIVEMVPEEGPKPGDVMVNKFESMYLFKGVVSHNRHSYFAVVGRSGRTVYDSVTIPGRPATPEEAQPLWDALKKAGKRWNPETMQVEEVPKPGDVMINERDSVYIFKEVINPNSHSQYAWLGKAGNLFIDYGRCAPGRPATPEEAKPLFDALKKAGKKWNPKTMQVEDDMDAVERCRIMDYLEGFPNDETWNHEQLCWLIEVYLERKEGEK